MVKELAKETMTIRERQTHKLAICVPEMVAEGFLKRFRLTRLTCWWLRSAATYSMIGVATPPRRCALHQVGICNPRLLQIRWGVVVGRSRYAEKSQTEAARRNLHEHSDADVGVILQPIVRKRQHDHIIHRRL
jgi:hypothetical protein